MNSPVSSLARHLCAPLRRPPQAEPFVMPLELPAVPEVPGCGWFDSSQDLRSGLELVEVAWEEAALQCL